MKARILVLLVLLVLVMGVGTVQAQSPLPTPTVTPGPGEGNGGDDGGGAELPEITVDLTVMAVIVGLVEFMKQMGVSGRGSLASSMGLGVVLGGAAWLSAQGTPDDLAGWFAAVIVGLIYGLASSGLYDVGKKWQMGK